MCKVHNYKSGIRVKVMVFDATFNNISDISWRSVLFMEYQKKTKDPPQVTDKLYHIHVMYYK